MSYLLSERHYRRNQSYVLAIINAYPQVIKFDVEPPITQPDVLARNIRYAARSLQCNQWETPDLPWPKFLQCWDDIVISATLEPGKVVCGPEETIRKISLMAVVGGSANANALQYELSDPAPQQVTPQINVTNPSVDLITAIFVFHHHRYLTEPSTITTTDDVTMIQLSQKYDVGVQRDGTTYKIL